jgi:hypothetical protein
MSDDIILYEKCIKLANNIYENIDEICNNERIKKFIDGSENILNKYIELLPSLTYHQVLSLYISTTFIFFYY